MLIRDGPSAVSEGQLPRLELTLNGRRSQAAIAANQSSFKTPFRLGQLFARNRRGVSWASKLTLTAHLYEEQVYFASRRLLMRATSREAAFPNSEP